MNKLIYKFGLISGAVLFVELVITFTLMDKHSTEMGMGGAIFGYSTMIVAFLVSMLFALKAYGKQVDAIKPLKAMLLCLGIAVMASIIYVLTWAFIYKFIFPNFKEWWMACVDSQEKAGKVTLEDKKMYTEMMANYDKPLYFTFYTLMEVLPVGILMSVLTSLIYWLAVRNKKAN